MRKGTMTKTRKRSPGWTLGIILLLLAFVLSGCGGQTEESTTQLEESPAEKEVAAAPEEAASSPGEVNDRESVVAKLSSMIPPEELSYEMTFSSQEYNATTQIWMKGDKIRMESTSDVQEQYIVIEDGDDLYMLDPDEMTGIKMTLSEEEDFFEDDFDNDFMDGDYDWDNMRYLGTEVIKGIQTYVFEADDEYEKVKLWIHADYGFPVRMEGEEEGKTYLMEINNFKIGGVSDSMFQVPSGYEIMEMNW